jgi:hypothetical protein
VIVPSDHFLRGDAVCESLDIIRSNGEVNKEAEERALGHGRLFRGQGPRRRRILLLGACHVRRHGYLGRVFGIRHRESNDAREHAAEAISTRVVTCGRRSACQLSTKGSTDQGADLANRQLWFGQEVAQLGERALVDSLATVRVGGGKTSRPPESCRCRRQHLVAGGPGP